MFVFIWFCVCFVFCVCLLITLRLGWVVWVDWAGWVGWVCSPDVELYVALLVELVVRLWAVGWGLSSRGRCRSLPGSRTCCASRRVLLGRHLWSCPPVSCTLLRWLVPLELVPWVDGFLCAVGCSFPSGLGRVASRSGRCSVETPFVAPASCSSPARVPLCVEFDTFLSSLEWSWVVLVVGCECFLNSGWLLIMTLTCEINFLFSKSPVLT